MTNAVSATVQSPTSASVAAILGLGAGMAGAYRPPIDNINPRSDQTQSSSATNHQGLTYDAATERREYSATERDRSPRRAGHDVGLFQRDRERFERHRTVVIKKGTAEGEEFGAGRCPPDLVKELAGR